MSTLFYADDGISFLNLRFENDVKMYGTQAMLMVCMEGSEFENDIKMYGTQATGEDFLPAAQFENDVKMYGTQANSTRK